MEATELLGIQANTGKELGTQVHALFENVEWWEKKADLSKWLEQQGKGTSKQAMDIFSRAMADPEVKKIFSLPAQKTEVWRERSFAYAKGGQNSAGCF